MNMVRFSYNIQNVLGNTVRSRNASTNYVQIKGDSWQFFTIREIFSLR